MKRLNYSNLYCRQMPEGDSIFNKHGGRICRLFAGHKGEHVWSYVLND